MGEPHRGSRVPGPKATSSTDKGVVTLGTAVMDLKRQEIKKKLVQYALEKELDFPQAERAAEVVSNRLDDNTLKEIVDVLAN